MTKPADLGTQNGMFFVWDEGASTLPIWQISIEIKYVSMFGHGNIFMCHAMNK